MGRPFLLGGLRARVSSWPPLRLARLRCERVSVGVVPSQRFPIGDGRRGARDGRDTSAWMCTASSRNSRWSRTGWSATRAGSGSRRKRCARGQSSLRADDEVALEATGNSDAIATLLTPLVARVVVSNPSKTRAIAEAKVKTDKVDARILAQLLAADFLPPVWLPDDRTRSSAAAGDPPGPSGPAADEDQEPGPRDPGPQPCTDTAGVGPVRQDRPALAADSAAAGR